MIDRLAELLGEAQPAEEKGFLPELLRQSGQTGPGVAAVSPAEEEKADPRPEEMGAEDDGLQALVPPVFSTGQTVLSPAAGQAGLPPAAGQVDLPLIAGQVDLPLIDGQVIHPAAAPDRGPAEGPTGERPFLPRSGQEGIAALTALVGQAVEREHSLSAMKQMEGAAREPSAVRDLYRRAVEGVQAGLSAQLRPSPVMIREEHTAGVGLTARELDCAVRRDSRRYDGAMHIY